MEAGFASTKKKRWDFHTVLDHALTAGEAEFEHDTVVLEFVVRGDEADAAVATIVDFVEGENRVGDLIGGDDVAGGLLQTAAEADDRVVFPGKVGPVGLVVMRWKENAANASAAFCTLSRIFSEMRG